MKTQAELTELLDFIGEYATYLLGSGVHTSRVVRAVSAPRSRSTCG